MYKIKVQPEDIENLPLGTFEGKIIVIDGFGPKYLSAIAYLSRQRVIGFDTETRPCFSPGQRGNGIALLQLSGEGKAFLFRIKSLGMQGALCRILSNEHILKIGAAVNDDIHGLQRYRKFKPGGFIDLQKIVWEYGIYDKSVKKMAANILGVKISKAQQLSNWEAEELSESQLKYAATDAWICRKMYLKLISEEKHPLTADQLYELQHQQPQQAAKDQKH